MSWFLGIDTSNYTTSVAAWNPKIDTVLQEKKPLPVKEGTLGLRQSDAVFSHVNQLGELVKNVLGQVGEVSAVGVSTRPRRQKNSYMPCFLVGQLVAESIGAALRVPVHFYSHQEGHIVAAAYSAGNLGLVKQPLIAFHLSGGTTECVLVTPEEDGYLSSQILYESLDLYAGQAVDRVGGMLDLSFPAGPELELLAQKSEKSYRPRPYFDEKGNPSLSGVENQCKAMIQQGEAPEDTAKYCLQWISSVVQNMTKRAKDNYPDLPVLYAGGVMSNLLIQQEVSEAFGGYFSAPAFSADNAAGVALLAGLKEKGANIA